MESLPHEDDRGNPTAVRLIGNVLDCRPKRASSADVDVWLPVSGRSSGGKV